MSLITTGFSLHGAGRFTIIARMRRLAQHLLSPLFVLVTFCLMSAPARAQTCPDLAPFYETTDWVLLESQLNVLLPRCLTSSEYFALLGVAQMNNQRLAPALESLERALLLNPDNGAAQIDYAQALYLQGELFTALEINGRLLARDDLPADIGSSLSERQDSWRRLTRQFQLQGDVLAGYDENLNGAPAPSQITITLPDDSVVLPLGSDSRPIAGPYANLKLAGRYRQLAPEHQHNVLVELSHRLSEDKSSDFTQLDARYAWIRPGRRHGLQLDSGVSNLLFGGKPLYTATSFGGSYSPRIDNSACRFDAGLSTQHQLFHNQSFLNAIESRLTFGSTCATGFDQSREQVGMQLSLIDNQPVRDGRPGGHRDGWQLNAVWQRQAGNGVWRTQLNHTRLFDAKAYSELLSGGAPRWLRRSYALIQYRRPIRPQTEFLINMYYQYQGSNIELFQSRDRSFEMGVSHAF